MRTEDTCDGTPQANYAVFEGLSGDAQTIQIIRGSNNSGIHGIQIVSVQVFDEDEDGFELADDCDDTDPESTSRIGDEDCDGVLFDDDCDDWDPESTTVATDADCDGSLTADDCDDTDPSISPEATEVDDGVDNDCDDLVDADDPEMTGRIEG